MEQSVSRNFTNILLFAAGVLFLRWAVGHLFVSNTSFQEVGYSYEMPRPKIVSDNFSLADRELDRNILKENEEQKATESNAKKLNPVNAVAAKTGPAKGATAAAGAALKKKFEVSVTDTSRKTGLSSENHSTENSVYSYNASVTNVSNNQTGTPEKKEKENKKTIEEWLALLTANPSAQTIAEFVTAKNNSEISSAQFYATITTLFKSDIQQSQQTALSILSTEASDTAFVYMAKLYSTVDKPRQEALWKIMLGYADPVRLAALGSALNSSDSQVVTLGLNVLNVAVQSTSTTASNPGNGSAGSAGSTVRSVAVQSTIDSLKNFETTLTTLSSSASPDNSTLAKSLLDSIKNLNNGSTNPIT